MGQVSPQTFSNSLGSPGRHPTADYQGYSPEIMVIEYMAYSTGGMILGSLVANAIGRMGNLEIFSWDMPTGVHPRVFEALGSLAHRPGRTFTRAPGHRFRTPNPLDGPSLEQIDHRARWLGESTVGARRLGGVLGLLVGKVYDIPKRKIQAQPALDAPGFQPGETTPFLPTLSKGLKSGSPNSAGGNA
ncbi:hypothetical protein CHGG_05940 [Chaetomium globosum CBS 148.51]|uniref:Uncharacterized protein n=1 Tax=Chaetomium globosum (strain ATCC 6205 / CBS 148.51 / DSM 1962 / NBRC 6347 / NRRL 1970) TaxID=306901 RepID=Q2H5X5_CHAGB|nr:uncharacterized protein CHGG_05940 [Chaetomium globosum CBS 148.51]EAQ89321.1 hypothetical protein CHGG_05940 [Chaetomium globosum CBS 148.51]